MWLSFYTLHINFNIMQHNHLKTGSVCVTRWRYEEIFVRMGPSRRLSIAGLKDFLPWACILWRKMKLEKYKNKILWRAAWKPEYLNWSDRQLLRNVYNHNAYFSGNGIRTCFSFRGNQNASGSCVAKQEIEGFNRVSSLQSTNNSKEDGYRRINQGVRPVWRRGRIPPPWPCES
jgi:hypothetical protein